MEGDKGSCLVDSPWLIVSRAIKGCQTPIKPHMGNIMSNVSMLLALKLDQLI